MISSLIFTLAFQMAAQANDPGQALERTIFQTGSTYTDRINLRADVAVVYGFDKSMPDRVKAWRARGYRIHLMTGVAWGEYQDYYYGRFDGVDHQEEAQTRQNGEKIGHGGDVYYMSPGINYGRFLAAGVRRALDAGVEAVHLEEPEFWTWGGYGNGFKNEWKAFYHEPWQDPLSSPDARWRAAKLMYYLYRRALQQVFDSIQDYNKGHGTHVRCYVPTHSLINYASWGIVSPESSLAKLKGCDGYIAQVWTGTARTPNIFQGVKKERTFETAFLEYGAMQNLVHSTGRSVWYLADPIEDNPDHDWGDYRNNYHSTLIASLLQPEVSQYEVMPWPERIFNGKYPSEANKRHRVPIPPSYATELQVVINALKDMKQKSYRWQCGSQGIGVMVSDSLMFQRGGPSASDEEMGHLYGLALPFVKRGMPVQPVQLENVTLPGYLNGLKLILMSYEGMKPLSPEVHFAIANWVRSGGILAFIDADKDPFLKVREWWNSDGKSYQSPREHLFERLGLPRNPAEGATQVGRGQLIYFRRSPTEISRDPAGADWLARNIRDQAKSFTWSETSSLVLRRGPYVIGAGLDESISNNLTLLGSYVDLFDPLLKVQTQVTLEPNSRHFLIDLAKSNKTVVACAGRVTPLKSGGRTWQGAVEGIADTQGILLLRLPSAPTATAVNDQPIADTRYDAVQHLLWLRFPNSSKPQVVRVVY